MPFGPNTFTQSIKVLAADFASAVPVFTFQIQPDTTVGGMVDWVSYDSDGTDNEAQAGLAIFSLAMQPDGTLSSGLSAATPLRAASGSDTSGSVTWAIDTSGPLPILTVDVTPDLTVDDATVSYHISYFGGTWGGGEATA